MNKADNDFVVVGKIGSTYGIQGWLKVFTFTEDLNNILEFNPWYLESKEGWEKIEVKEAREHGKCVVVKFAGYHKPEQARVLTGKKVAIKREQLPTLKQDEYYWADLEGLTVINQDGKALGIIAYLIETGSNDVLVVKDEKGKEHAIPYLPSKVVLSIDLASRTMRVDWDLV